MPVTGPDFISLQVRDLESSAAFYENYLGLVRTNAGPTARRRTSSTRPTPSSATTSTASRRTSSPRSARATRSSGTPGTPGTKGVSDVVTDFNSQVAKLATSDPKTILSSTQKNLEALLK